jgi:hypothetical protein
VRACKGCGGRNPRFITLQCTLLRSHHPRG